MCAAVDYWKINFIKSLLIYREGAYDPHNSDEEPHW